LVRNIAAVAVVAALLAAATAGAQAVIDGGDVRNNSLTGRDVKNKSLTKADFRGSVRGKRGLPGPPGPAGPQGPQGPPGPVNLAGITKVEATEPIPAGGFEVAAAICPSGQRAISGGGTVITASGGLWVSEADDTRTAWLAGGEDLAGGGGDVTAVAYCVPAGAATAASNRRYRIHQQVRRLIRKREAFEG
jgi:hypothetical protein